MANHFDTVEIIPLTWQSFLEQATLTATTTAYKKKTVGLAGWPFGFTHAFFDDFPLPIKNENDQVHISVVSSQAHNPWSNFCD